jgi:hypothetical protein
MVPPGWEVLVAEDGWAAQKVQVAELSQPVQPWVIVEPPGTQHGMSCPQCDGWRGWHRQTVAIWRFL